MLIDANILRKIIKCSFLKSKIFQMKNFSEMMITVNHAHDFSKSCSMITINHVHDFRQSCSMNTVNHVHDFSQSCSMITVNHVR